MFSCFPLSQCPKMVTICSFFHILDVLSCSEQSSDVPYLHKSVLSFEVFSPFPMYLQHQLRDLQQLYSCLLNKGCCTNLLLLQAKSALCFLMRSFSLLCFIPHSLLRTTKESLFHQWRRAIERSVCSSYPPGGSAFIIQHANKGTE